MGRKRANFRQGPVRAKPVVVTPPAESQGPPTDSSMIIELSSDSGSNLTSVSASSPIEPSAGDMLLEQTKAGGDCLPATITPPIESLSQSDQPFNNQRRRKSRSFQAKRVAKNFIAIANDMHNGDLELPTCSSSIVNTSPVPENSPRKKKPYQKKRFNARDIGDQLEESGSNHRASPNRRQGRKNKKNPQNEEDLMAINETPTGNNEVFPNNRKRQRSPGGRVRKPNPKKKLPRAYLPRGQLEKPAAQVVEEADDQPSKLAEPNQTQIPATNPEPADAAESPPTGNEPSDLPEQQIHATAHHMEPFNEDLMDETPSTICLDSDSDEPSPAHPSANLDSNEGPHTSTGTPSEPNTSSRAACQSPLRSEQWRGAGALPKDSYTESPRQRAATVVDGASTSTSTPNAADQAENPPEPSDRLSNNRKRKREDTLEPVPVGCSICLQPTDPLGDHQIVSLKCGHLYGFNCIVDWFTAGQYRCPKCNDTSDYSEIRRLLNNRIAVVDNSVQEDARNELELKRRCLLDLLAESERLQQQQESNLQLNRTSSRFACIAIVFNFLHNFFCYMKN